MSLNVPLRQWRKYDLGCLMVHDLWFRSSLKWDYLAIDPGREFGIAAWNEEKIQFCSYVTSPVEALNKDWLYWVHCLFLGLLMDRLKPRVIMEYPTAFISNRGQTAIESGSLVKLSMSAGALACAVCSGASSVEYVKPQQWKGQLPKSVVEKRIKRKLHKVQGIDQIKSHAVDAVGIGLYGMGKMI